VREFRGHTNNLNASSENLHYGGHQTEDLVHKLGVLGLQNSYVHVTLFPFSNHLTY
jgi:hypothetical protein